MLERRAIRWAVTLRRLAGAVLLFAAAGVGAQTGARLPATAHYDAAIADLLARWNLPGAAVAVTKDGRLVLARGYGQADAAGTPVEPTARFRLASVSKPLTALAVLRLAQDGRVDLDAPLYPFLGIEETADPRALQVTIRQALEHSGGWDAAAEGSGDVLFMPRTVAAAFGLPSPPDAAAITAFQISRASELDFAPGTRFAYSNYGYLLLSLVIEHATGRPYEQAMHELLAGAGVHGLLPARSAPAQRAAGEVSYFDHPAADLVRPVDDRAGIDRVARPDGGFAIESLAGAGAWVASAVDLLRVLAAVEGLDGRAPLLDATMRAEMTARPDRPDAERAMAYYAKGWKVRPTRDGGANWWHEGALPGSAAYLVRLSNGVSYAALFNARPQDVDAFFADLDRTLFAAQARVAAWPAENLFEAFEAWPPSASGAPVSAGSRD